MRAQILALAVAALPGVTACSIDVYEGGGSHRAPLSNIAVREYSSNAAGDLVVYPRARRIANTQPEPANVSFSGSFSDARVFPESFESDDEPARVLGFYRAALRADSDVIECRGRINIRRSRRTEKPVCIEHRSSQVVQLAAGTRSSYRLVAVKPRGTATEFTLATVYVR